MFLRNYTNFAMLRLGAGMKHADWNYVKSGYIYDQTVKVGGGFGSNEYLTMKTGDGTVKGLWYDGRNEIPFSMAARQIVLGTGNTPVAYNDNKMSGTVIDNTPLTFVRDSVTYDAASNCFVKTVQYTYTNNTGSDIVINEWGISVDSGSANNKFSNTSNSACLIYREVLAAPITIVSGTTATLNFTISIPMPVAP